MKMESIQAVRPRFFKMVNGHAQTGTGSAGIINRMFSLGGTLRIDPESNADAFFPAKLLVFFQLGKGIEYDVFADIRQFLHLRLFKGRSKHMILLPHLLMAQSCFKQAAGRGTIQILTN